MPQPEDEYDDAFFRYVGDMAARAQGLERILSYIRDNLGQVCPEFEICDHRSCRASCEAWLLADAGLKGQYALPGEPEDDPQDPLFEFDPVQGA